MKVELRSFEARASNELNFIFSEMSKWHADAVLVPQDTLFIANAQKIAMRAGKLRLPSAGTPAFGEAGCLIGYGGNDSEQYRRAAIFIDKILKGTKPGDIPMEEPSKFDFVLNLKTAKALGIKVPQSILVQATRVIE